MSNAAGCGSALKEYAEYFGDDPAWSQRAQAFSARVRDVTEVLDAVELDPRLGRLEATVTYQEPCHLAHAQRVTGAPRRLLQKIPGLRLVEMRESAVCCGGAGIYNLTQPETLGPSAHTQDRCGRGNRRECGRNRQPRLRNAGYRRITRGWIESSGKHVVELLDEAYRAYGAAVTRA